MSEVHLRHEVPLSTLTTLEVGGPAAALASVDSPQGLRSVLELADDRRWPVRVIGGGSNLLASDRGFEGLLVQYVDDHRSGDLQSGHVHVGAGHDWDALVAWSVEHDLSGLECLSGIPGRVGAAPIQNVGAYGREVASFIETVHALDLRDGRAHDFDAHDCHFAYRDSRFKRDEPTRWCVTSVDLRLEPHARPEPAYAELARALSRFGPEPPLSAVRETVLEIRRRKSMVLDDQDPNRRSAGSFFTNPVVAASVAARIEDEVGDEAGPLPRYPAGADRVKIPAAWLIERAGLHRGWSRGPAGLSENHVLALVNRGGATAEDLLAVAREVRDRVLDEFGVRLVPEPMPLGFRPGEVDDLWPQA